MKQIHFTTRETPRGCTVEVTWPSGRKQSKRFRNGYAHSTLSAEKWIAEQIGVVKEFVEIEGWDRPEIFINGVQKDF